MTQEVLKKSSSTAQRNRVHFEEKDVVSKPKTQGTRRKSIMLPPATQKTQGTRRKSLTLLPATPPKSNQPGSDKGDVKLFKVVKQEAQAGGSEALAKLPFQRNIVAPQTRKRIHKIGGLVDSSPSDEDISIKFDHIGIPRRRSTLNLYSNRQVIDILSTIREQQNNRQKKQISSELDKIKVRVRKTLENVDMESDSEDEEITQLAGGPVKFPPIFDSRAEREKMQERNFIIGNVEKFEEKAIVRMEYLTELAEWFDANQKLNSLDISHFDVTSFQAQKQASDVLTPEEMKDRCTYTQELHTIISESLETFINNGEKVVELGNALLKETSKLMDEKRALMTKKTKKERIIVYDDKTLMLDPMKWEVAARNIISVFDDCQKMIKNLMFKNALKLGQRQFEYLMVAAEKRYKDLDEKKKTINELNGKLHQAKLQGERMSRDLEEQKKKMTKVTNELVEAKQALDKLTERNKEMSRKIVELTSKTRYLEENLREKMRTPTPPPTPPPPPEPETVVVKVIDSSTALELEEVEKELQEAKEEIEKLLADLSSLQENLRAEKDLNTKLKEQVQELESREIPEAATTTPMLPSPVIEQTPEFVPDKDANYYKTLMAGMKKDFLTEMEKVKFHVQREKARGEAGQRKVEIQHKEHLAIVQKDTIRMLRGIMHFRDHMLACLQKENLLDQAQQLHELGSLLKDKLSPDPREVLAMLVGTVIEYLHNMEGILSNSFLAMKVLMKYQVDKQLEHEVQLRMAKEKQDRENKKVIKDCKVKKEEIKGASKDINKLAKRLKKAKNKLKKYQKNMDGVAPSSDRRYNDLVLRYKQVINMYQNMQKEMENLQSDFHDTMKKKLEEKETMVISQIKMEIKQQKVINEENLKLTIADQKENLKLLTRAYEENKISRELHSMATAMVQKTLEIPQTKLRNLFEQYIAYRAVQESKKRVEALLSEKESDLAIDTRIEMRSYLEQLDNKFSSSMGEWKQQMKDLETEKRELNKKIYKLFNELLLETGVLLIHPLLRDSNKQTILNRAAAMVTKKQMKAMLFKRKRGFKSLLGVPDGIQGLAIGQGAPMDQGWTLPPQRKPPSEPVPGVIAPHMLAYEVNKPRILAQRSLQTRAARSSFKPGRTESFMISDHNYLQFIRDAPFQWTGNLLV